MICIERRGEKRGAKTANQVMNLFGRVGKYLKGGRNKLDHKSRDALRGSHKYRRSKEPEKQKLLRLVGNRFMTAGYEN